MKTLFLASHFESTCGICIREKRNGHIAATGPGWFGSARKTRCEIGDSLKLHVDDGGSGRVAELAHRLPVGGRSTNDISSPASFEGCGKGGSYFAEAGQERIVSASIPVAKSAKGG
jgi:hypothetical protein